MALRHKHLFPVCVSVWEQGAGWGFPGWLGPAGPGLRTQVSVAVCVHLQGPGGEIGNVLIKGDG